MMNVKIINKYVLIISQNKIEIRGYFLLRMKHLQESPFSLFRASLSSRVLRLKK